MLYAITDRRLCAADEENRRRRLRAQTALWAANGVVFIQLREKDLSGSNQVELARAMLKILRAGPNPSRARLLINGRPDMVLAAGADGVHLPAGADALTPNEVRGIFAATGRMQPPYISVSCHTLAEAESARQREADCILFAPVFEKRIFDEQNIPTARQKSGSTQIFPGIGVALLEQACTIAGSIPVFALGGVTMENAAQCLEVGAAGIAAIRWMLEPPSAWLNFT